MNHPISDPLAAEAAAAEVQKHYQRTVRNQKQEPMQVIKWASQ